MILIVSATLNEVEPLLPKGAKQPLLGVPTPIGLLGNNQVAILITGVGAVPTTFWLTRNLTGSKFDLVVNIGVAGSFDSGINLGDVVLVSEDSFADYGIDNRGKFVSLFDSGLSNPNQSPYNEGRLLWPHQDRFPYVNQFPKVKGITVGTTSGSEERIKNLVDLYSPDIETMESASVFYTCISLHIPFICLRAISNYVEPRDKSKWNLPLAISSLCEQTRALIGSL